MLTLVSNSNTEYKIKRDDVDISLTIKNLIEDTGIDQPIKFDNINDSTLTLILDYCQNYKNEGWSQQIINMDITSLTDLVLAANYLDISLLLDLGCEIIANRLKGKSSEGMREILQVTSDFSPEEEEKIRKEHEWMLDN